MSNEKKLLENAEAENKEANNSAKPATVASEDLQAQCLYRKRLSIKRVLALGGGLAALAIVIALICSAALAGEPAAILVNGQQVAALKNQAQAETVIADYLAEQGEAVGNEVFFAENVQVAEKARAGSDVLNRREAQEALAMTTTLKTNGAVIKVDGSQLLSVASADIARQALDNLKTTYLPEDTATLQVLEVKFVQDVEVAPKEVFVSDILNLDEAKLAMKDTSLTGAAPVTVRVILEKTKQEEVPYQTRFETDGTLRYGQTKTKQTGVNGQREVTIQLAQENGVEIARQEISSNTLVEAVDEIILEGGVVQTASRSLQQATDAGMIWPTNATRISSYYGPRSDDNHTGMDIDGEMGDPVWAAKAGTVVTAGYYGTYGNQVVISHGDGLQTRYAHMQSISVNVGDEVAIGQQIGTEGSTGNSTGSHLHFEVIINGSTTDPLPYIK